MTNEERYKTLFSAYLAGQTSTDEFCDHAERLGEQAEAELVQEEIAPASLPVDLSARDFYTGKFADRSQRIREHVYRTARPRM